MSAAKYRHESERWFSAAEDDLRSANVLSEAGQCAHACFHCQQAAEKALKALHFQLGGDPWGHSVKKLIDDLVSLDTDAHASFASLNVSAVKLDRFYIPTRYPDGMPELTTNAVYYKEDVEEGLVFAENILKAVVRLKKG